MPLPTANVTPGTGLVVNTLQNGGQTAPANCHPFTLDTSVETAPGTAGTLAVTVQGNAAGVAVPVSGSGIQPVSTTVAASNIVIKSSPGSLFGLTVVTGGSAGYLMLFDAVAAPADGVVTPVYVMPVAVNTGLDVGRLAFTPMVFLTGIVAVFSTTGPFTKTASATAFITGSAR